MWRMYRAHMGLEHVLYERHSHESSSAFSIESVGHLRRATRTRGHSSSVANLEKRKISTVIQSSNAADSKRW
ncbi:uncharacterized protein BT62DRAFT_604484 [Guyanagaster necrorhizus]|uniref:Uncharacterized protein n=1 Tax=Guyanagaster necrorhizus TaxID=856835 RepID=A0A9P8AXA4_9AGAR|nr:uncharacterized protein BT62DRAFT_604484 [Guyanagaster necrorhizus MCA 3950]KAG7449737.1 hypothetical protein BT62DRAFT_604484 [Guyanagaster necrorhizus MCA 3950]